MRFPKIRRGKVAAAQTNPAGADDSSGGSVLTAQPTITVKDTVGGGGEATVDWQEETTVGTYLKQALEITIPAGDKRIVTLGGKQVKLGGTVPRPEDNAVLIIQHKVANG